MAEHRNIVTGAANAVIQTGDIDGNVSIDMSGNDDWIAIQIHRFPADEDEG